MRIFIFIMAGENHPMTLNTLAISETRRRFVMMASDWNSVIVRWNLSVEMFYSKSRGFINSLISECG